MPDEAREIGPADSMDGRTWIAKEAVLEREVERLLGEIDFLREALRLSLAQSQESGRP